MNRKTFILVLICGSLILLGAALLLFVDFDSPKIGQAFLNEVGRSTNLQWSAGAFRLNLLSGLYLEDVTMSGLIGDRPMEARIRKMQVKHRLLPLLRRRISAREIIIVAPQVNLYPAEEKDAPTQKQRKDSPKEADAIEVPVDSQAEEKPAKVEIAQMQIQDAAITVHSFRENRPEAVINSISLTFSDVLFDSSQTSLLQRLSAEGEAEADEILVGKTRIEKMEGKVSVEEGVIHGKDVSFETEHGEFEADIALNVKSNPVTYNLQLKGDPLNTNVLIGASEQDDFGPTRVEFQGEGFGSRSTDLKGSGKFTVEDGRLGSLPVFETIERIIGDAEIVGAPYEAGTTSFEIREDRIHFDHFQVQIEQGSLDLNGWITLNGPIQLTCNVRVPRKNVKIKEVPREVLDALTDDAGQITLPFQIRGVPENPVTQLDTGALLARAGEGTKRMLKRKLSEKIRDLLKKRN